MSFSHTLSTVDDLRSVYRSPSATSVAKQLDRLDDHCRDFIAHSPFVLVASGSREGRMDVSPKGGRPGFVRVLDETRLAIPDMSGNNRLDTLENLVAAPGIGLLFCVPGFDETLRVNGRATITTDPAVLAACTDGDLRPRVAIGVDVDEAYVHCAKALRRSGLWDPARWPDLSELPSAARMLRDHCDIPGEEVEDVERRLSAGYEATTWKVAGEPG
jgi:PPOX class probable FMN-dependent enzyme